MVNRMHYDFYGLKKSHHLLATLLTAFALMTVWRGLWHLLDYYAFPGDFVLSAVVPMIVGIVLIAGLQSDSFRKNKRI